LRCTFTFKCKAFRATQLEGETNLDLLKLLGEVTGKEIKIKFVSDRPGHDRRYCMNTRLSYETTPLKEGLRKTYEWYLENEWWWRPLIADKFFKEDEPWK